MSISRQLVLNGGEQRDGTVASRDGTVASRGVALT